MEEICKFCGDAHLRPDMAEVGPMPGGTLYLHRDQSHPGRLLMVSARHVRKITDLSPEEYAALMDSVYQAAQAVTALCQPDKINYLVFGDTSTHLHVHIVPKYRQGGDWGKVFLTDEPNPVYLTEREYEESVTALRLRLGLTEGENR